jgi:hypothetical protein
MDKPRTTSKLKLKPRPASTTAAKLFLDKSTNLQIAPVTLESCTKVQRSKSLIVVKSWEAMEDFVNPQEVISLLSKRKEEDLLLNDFMGVLHNGNNDKLYSLLLI